jgi:lipoprotein-anchoring transpeptidase ErfK/SrfK
MRGWGLLVLVLGLVLAVPGASAAERLEAVRLQGLALLREPNGGAAMIRPLRAGETVTVYGREGDYVKVTTGDGTQGYVHGGFLTGFDDIAPLKAYASRIDPEVTRPSGRSSGEEKKAAPAKAAVPAPRGETPSPIAVAPRPLPPYAPVADGGGLELYIANLNRLSASGEASRQAALATDFNARKNRYSIEVHLSERKLFLYENLPDGSRHLAKAYIVAVPGRDMEAPQGWGVVTGISFEPWWRPTVAMKERALKKGKSLPEVVKPGVKENPMGPFKIILSHGFGFRIHGNNNPGSIGRPVTSGCIRMRNDEGKDLAKMIDVGTEVVFLE